MKTVTVTDVASYTFCPRKLFFQRRGVGISTPALAKGSFEHDAHRLIAEKLPWLYPRLLRMSDPLEALRAQIQELVEYCLKVAQSSCPLYFSELALYAEEMRGRLESQEIRRFETVRARVAEGEPVEDILAAVFPWRVEYPVVSEVLGLRGRVDQVFRVKGELYPVDLKTTSEELIPILGESDAVQLCAYGMLLEERFGGRIETGLIEYTVVGRSERVVFSVGLRAQVLDAVENAAALVEQIENGGEMPGGIQSGERCAVCFFRELCLQRGEIKQPVGLTGLFHSAVDGSLDGMFSGCDKS